MEAPELERRLAAILAADVEGYSRLMHGDEEATMATLSARRALVDELITRHRGRIANTAGDSVLAEFVSVLDAVRCAIEVQEALAGSARSPAPYDPFCDPVLDINADFRDQSPAPFGSERFARASDLGPILEVLVEVGFGA
jgi:hypothetical protein